MADPYHIPALLIPSVDGLNIRPDGVYVDVTFGGGGHSREILRRLGAGKLIAFDQDEDAVANCPSDPRFVFVRSNFRYLTNFLRYHNVDAVDGVLADLGVSFHHFDQAERGFSFRFDGRLDMRMNRQAAKTAAAVLNTYSEERLADIFYFYGELREARKIARKICQTRNENPFETIAQLLEVLKPFFFKEKEKKEMAKVFQALRIEVNDEMETLKIMLQQAVSMLKPHGRLVVLTYHSLEDRLVKNFMKTGNFEGKLEKDFYGNPLCDLKLINSKAIVADAAEVEANPRSRSAKLRIAEKK
ncbi:MAG: 16S rRNA (cytosine(1402)-N(4))-methyltransferase RsmH [Prevotellaceae bacterium]|jgi:16S rRNA (cytosine1402-N4)-methyltransferase|nr:16S rRNA (cytosine(1402)-N(4))-methyltransferase RsmH [Prevotellaceae bacterium]